MTSIVTFDFLWLPGLVANVVYLIQASNDQKITGHSPQCRGCLLALLVVFLGLPIVAGGCVFIFLVLSMVGAST